MRLQYTDLRDQVAERYGSPELTSGQDYIEGTLDQPFYQVKFLDRVLLRCVKDVLRETPAAEIDSLGIDMLYLIFRHDGDPLLAGGLPDNYWPIRILSWSIYESGNQGPGQPVSETEWYQRKQSDDANYVWSVVSGAFRVKAAQLNLYVLIEPTIDDLKADKIVVPDGSDREIVEKAVRWLKFADDMEQGRS